MKGRIKMKILDLCSYEPDNIFEAKPRDMFEYSSPRSRSGYLDSVNSGNLDGMCFELSEIDKKVFIIDDGGELFRLKDGTYINVCLRGDVCRVWEEDNEERIKYFNEKLGIK